VLPLGPTVGLLCGIDGILGTLVVLPGPGPPGTPTPPGLNPPEVPVVGLPVEVPLGAEPAPDDPALPEVCAAASVEPARKAKKVRPTAIESFMTEPVVLSV
jgi:hypothetical protein